MLKKYSIILSILSFTFLLACNDDSSNGGEQQEPDQKALLTNISDNLIVKDYQELAANAKILFDNASQLSETVAEDELVSTRDAFVAAYASWQKVGFYNFGPAETQGLLTLNLYPTDTSLILSNIESGSYNLSSASNSFAKGFPALDYLLFGNRESVQVSLARLSGKSNSFEYIKDVAEEISLLADEVNNDWVNYSSTFKNNLGTSNGSGLSLMVNAWSQYMEIHIRNAKVGTPNGNNVATNQRFGPFPEKMEGFYSVEQTKNMLRTTAVAVLNFYMGIDRDGNDGEGIYDYLIKINAQNGTLADDYKAQLEEIVSSIDKLDSNYETAILTQGDEVTSVFNSLKAAVALLKVDIVSALSISITYADNDGD